LATLYPNVSSSSKDDYNFFHSQIRIRVECAFEIHVLRWGIFRSAIPCNIIIVRTIALVSCLARLHKYCIDEVERTQELDKDTLLTDIEHMMNEPEGGVFRWLTIATTAFPPPKI